ncbi:hypothetical protein CTI12_AA000840 [Artemisia annua]|uniref:Uncharacterized protein n=1 Tax=Artemisia annua TaxID=35608 RepID=A0A2U1QMV1_ARTAN|nr:hypothetical protein CTI12_AA000840 [Artemisia annua]
MQMMQMMQKRSRSRSDVSRRAWNILRLALLWARKGGVFALKKRVMLDLSHFVKSLRHTNHKGNGALQYGDQQLSFDATPIIHVRMSRPNSMRFKLPHIPCINPHVDCSDMFDHFDDESERYSSYGARTKQGAIDIKAEEFIANFYEQLKLQRQVNARRRN